MEKPPREQTGLDILADRLALVLNSIKRPINADEIDLRMVGELAWAFDAYIDVKITPVAITKGSENSHE